MPGLVVVNGALLTCTKCPGKSSPLSVGGGPTIGEETVATITDHVVGENIEPFPGECQTTHEACAPQTPFPWFPGEPSALVPSLGPLIAETAVLVCTQGFGVIQVASAGQGSVNVNEPLNPECTPPPEPSFIEGLIDTLMMTDVANAPTLTSCIVESESQGTQMRNFALMVTPGVGVARNATRLRSAAKRTAATGAVAVELTVARSPSLLAAREKALQAAQRLALALQKHVEVSTETGELKPANPKIDAVYTLVKEAIKAST